MACQIDNVLLTFKLPLYSTNAMVLPTILHHYIGAANNKKILLIGLLVLPVCISLPIGGTDSFPQI
jgi:hypothetical protein